MRVESWVRTRWLVAAGAAAGAVILASVMVLKVLDVPRRAAHEAGDALARIAAAFRTGSVTLEFRDYVTRVSGMNRLQVAALQSVDTFTRTDSTAIFWDTVGLPDVEVQIQAPVEYTFYLDLDEPWDFSWDERTQSIVVAAPRIRAGTPAVDISGMTTTVVRGSFIRDEAKATAKLREVMPELARRQAAAKIPIIREIARTQVRRFVEGWFVQVKFKDAAVRPHLQEVLFADELGTKKPGRTAQPGSPGL
jgi:hypothetical protein